MLTADSYFQRRRKSMQVAYKNVSSVGLQPLNLEIPDQEFWVLAGPPGGGTSTALRCLAGLEQLTSGEILIGDRAVNHLSPKDRDIAMVFKNYALYPRMTARQNMGLGLKLRGVEPAEINRRVEEAAKKLGIVPLLDRKPGQMSAGQQQRVALGRAIVRRPAAFLFDDPLSNLDPKLRVEARAEISRLRHEFEAPALYATHDPLEAMALADRIAVLKEGRLQQVDTPHNLYNYPANRFVAGFIGSPAMNFFDGSITGEAREMYVDSGAVRLRLPAAHLAQLSREQIGQRVTFGIRPEDIHHPQFPPPGSITPARVDAFVEATELLGHETFAYLVAGEDQKFVARLDPRLQLRPGEPVNLICNADKLHLFATAEEEKAITTVVVEAAPPPLEEDRRQKRNRG
jgi:multiple sugar transport system ATP-binding protein